MQCTVLILMIAITVAALALMAVPAAEGATIVVPDDYSTIQDAIDNAVAGGVLLHSAGADYALHAPAEDNSRPVGEWNEVRMLVDGAQVSYWLNGVLQCSYELWSDDWNARVAASKFKQWPGFGMNKRGHIALQDHGNRSTLDPKRQS